MAREKEGWRLVWRRGIASVRFTHANKRFDISTRSKDSGQAQERAAQIYADVISGRVRANASGVLIHPGTPIEALVAEWIVAISSQLGEGTDETYTTYGKHWVRAFDTIGAVGSAGIGEYQRARLKSVERSTLTKERSALRSFLTWLVEQGSLSDVPEFPRLPKKAMGTHHKQGRSAPQGTLSPDEVKAVLSALPERGRGGIPVRAWFTLIAETSLRPATLRRVRPEHVTEAGLFIPKRADKNRRERTVPLTAAARSALASAPFEKWDLRESFRAAVRSALGESRKATPYDLRHARITEWADQGAPDTGIEFLSGTKQALALYKHASRRSAERTLWGHSGVEQKVLEEKSQETACEGGDLNPHGSYPASTSRKSESEIRRINLWWSLPDSSVSVELIPRSGIGHQRIALAYSAAVMGVLS